MTTQGTLLIVDDNAVDRQRIRRMLGDDYQYIEAEHGAEALRACDDARPDCVLLDYNLPDRNGLSLLSDVVARNLPTIMLTGQGAEDAAVSAMKAGACDYLVKGKFDGTTLDRAIRAARLQHKALLQQEELRSNKTQLFRILESIPAGIYVVTADGQPYYANTAATDILGKGLLDGFSFGERSETISSKYGVYLAGKEELYPFEQMPIVRALRGEAASADDMEIRLATGQRRRLDITGSPIFDVDGKLELAIAVFRDITDQIELEEQLRQAQKMEAIGRLAGGVAHDFNNLLTGIYSFGRFVLEQLDEGSQIHKDQSEVLRAAGRAQALTKQLLAFSRRQPVRPVVTRLDQVIEGSHRMLTRILGENIPVHLERKPPPRDGSPWNVRIDTSAFEQVVLNLAVNARDAMPSGGSLTLTTDYVTITTRNAEEPAREVTPGEYVRLSVTDTGHGMDRRIQEHIFEPFFTTKDKEKGTGLGLATCYGIVRQAGGFIEVESSPGDGTTFLIYLPRFEIETKTESIIPPTSQKRGTETIVVAEDDDVIRRIALRALGRAGYQVMAAPSGAEAYRLMEDREGKVDLLLTDVIMPEMSGRQLARRARRLHPEMRVLFMSGYTRSAVAQHGVIDDGVELLNKPFDPDQLCTEVRRVLDSIQPPPDDSMPRVLLVGEGVESQRIERALVDEHDVVRATTGSEALECLEDRDFSAVVCGAQLPDCSLPEMYRRCLSKGNDLEHRIVFIAEPSQPAPTKQFLAHAHQPVLVAPVDLEQLLNAISDIVEKRGQSDSRIQISPTNNAD